MKRRGAAVTGLGIITAIGSNIPSFWENLIKGTCGIDTVNLFDASHYRSQKAAEVKGFDPLLFFSARDLQRMSRCDQMGLKAASEAVRDSGLDWGSVDRERMGIYVGGGAGGILSAERYRKEMLQKGWRRVRPSLLLPFATCAVTDSIATLSASNPSGGTPPSTPRHRTKLNRQPAYCFARPKKRSHASC